MRLCVGRAGKRRIIVNLQDQTQLRPAVPRLDPGFRIVWVTVLIVICLAFMGCGEKKRTQVKLPPPPQIAVTASPEPAEAIPPSPPVHIPLPARPEPAKPKPWTQTGIASWYVADPGGQRTASGEPYNGAAMTAAHRTLPLQSLVRVTNLKTNRQVVVRINDRGPFVDGRIIDLSESGAKALDIVQAGLAKVELEVLHTPTAIGLGGKWCVQIGVFRSRDGALDLKKTLTARYGRARLQDFAGATGYWVRLLVQDDDRALAQKTANDIKVSEAGVFLVRLD